MAKTVASKSKSKVNDLPKSLLSKPSKKTIKLLLLPSFGINRKKAEQIAKSVGSKLVKWDDAVLICPEATFESPNLESAQKLMAGLGYTHVSANSVADSRAN
jgi:hypothetical protein